MSSLQRRKSELTTSSNPITSDKNLISLLSETKDLDSEEAFSGWKDSFLEQYKKYLDPAGVENAKASNGRLLRSLERLAKSVVTVNEFVKDGKITNETQSVQGKRHLTNMTDQMADTEKEVARFLPSTGAEEAKLGYDKFELGAVMIEDGFHVYEHLKTTRDIIQHLQELVLNEVLPNNKQSIIQFYLRQIQTFCDVMADLGLFGLMEKMAELYKIKPRSKSMTANQASPLEADEEVVEKTEKGEKVLDPNVKYTRRSAYTDGYFDPFSGEQPGREEFEDLKDSPEDDDQEGEGDDDENHFIIYFDMKTGTIGKIPRAVCRASGFIVSEDDHGNEEMQGKVENEAEKEQLIWDMKKAMKGGAPGVPKQQPRRNNSLKGKSDGPAESPIGSRKDLPKKGEEKPVPQKARSTSVRGEQPVKDEDTANKSRGLRRHKSEILPGASRSPGVLSGRPKVSRTSSGDGIATTKSPGALSKPKISKDSASGEGSSSTKSPGALSNKLKLSRDAVSEDHSSLTSKGMLSNRRLSQDARAGDGSSSAKSPGSLSKPTVSRMSLSEHGSSTKSPGTLSKRRIAGTKSGDGLADMSLGTNPTRRVSRSSSTKVERTALEGNSLAILSPSSQGWSTPSKIASKRRGDN